MKYDRQLAIDHATNLFWEKGFHATSMRNLQEVLDMRPGSIYASFGSKDGLFKETLRHYGETSQKLLTEIRNKTASPLEAIEKFFHAAVARSSSAPSDMCMLVKSVSELTEENADLLAEAKRLLKVVENGFAEILSEAKAIGELDASKDPERLARWLQMQLMGLRAYARANQANVNVEELVEDVLSSLRND